MFGAGGAIAETMKSTQHMREIFGAGSAFAEAMRTSQHMQEILGSSLASLSNVKNFSSAVNLINQEMALEGYAESNIIDPKTIESSIGSLSSADNSKLFAELFSRIPLAIQLFLLLHIILPQLNSISANLLTPYVNEIIENATSSKTDKVREIKKINPYLYGLPSEELRFISGSSVRLRSGPSTKSETLDLLMLGQIVVYIEKKRNWTNIMIQHDNGDVSTGWVFTRYVENFRR